MDRGITRDSLLRLGRHLRDGYARGTPSADYVALGIAVEFLRVVVGNAWANETIFEQHRTVSRRNRKGRTFVRATARTRDERFRWQERTLRIAELIFNLRDVPGLDGRIAELKSGNVESTYAELEAGGYLLRHGIAFRYVERSGVRQSDYDAEIAALGGPAICACEMKCKVEGTVLSVGTVRGSLDRARRQLPRSLPGVVFLKIPEHWVRQREVAPTVASAVKGFLESTSRVVAIVLLWETVDVLPDGGVAITYWSRVESELLHRTTDDEIASLVVRLNEPGSSDWTRLRHVAHAVCGPTITFST